MAYYRDTDVGPASYSLQDFAPTAGQSFTAAVSDAFGGNPTVLGLNLLSLNKSNDDPMARLTAYDAEAVIKESGVRGLKVEDGQYSKAALDILIERKRQEQIRQDVMQRTEYSLLGTPTRLTGMLAASVIDPMNIAAAFVPVVREARVTSMLGRFGVGSLERAGQRALIGAAEGGVGAALIEPMIYGARTELQDDYHMSDSLLNIAFGSALGGGLHVGGGHLADKFRAVDPYERFSGLNAKEVKTVLDFERTMVPNQTQSGVDAATANWSARMREAAGFGEKQAPAVPAPTTRIEMPESMSKEDFAKLYEQYPKEVTQSIINRVVARDGQMDAPFARLSNTTPEGARQIASRELADGMHSELIATAGNRAAPGDIAGIKTQLQTLAQQQTGLEGQFKTLAKDAQAGGLSRKAAEAQARKQIDATAAELESKRTALEHQVESNRVAAKAEQDIAALQRGEVPAQFNDLVQNRANQIFAMADTLRTVHPTAQSIVVAATPEARQAAFRSAIAQAVNGRLPDVDLLIKGSHDFEQLKAVSDRQAGADSLAIGSVAASRAADERLKATPMDGALKDAETEMQKVMERLTDLQKNLQQGGMDATRYALEMKPFTDAVAKADNFAAAAKAAAICGLRG